MQVTGRSRSPIPSVSTIHHPVIPLVPAPRRCDPGPGPFTWQAASGRLCGGGAASQTIGTAGRGPIAQGLTAWDGAEVMPGRALPHACPRCSRPHHGHPVGLRSGTRSQHGGPTAAGPCWPSRHRSAAAAAIKRPPVARQAAPLTAPPLHKRPTAMGLPSQPAGALPNQAAGGRPSRAVRALATRVDHGLPTPAGLHLSTHAQGAIQRPALPAPPAVLRP